MYDEKYYKTKNYEYYLGKGERYYKLAEEICAFLKSIKSIGPQTSILDYGCAVGFLLDGLARLGYSNIKGYEISAWAEQQVGQNHCIWFRKNDPSLFDVAFFLDVLEHMSDDEIEEALEDVDAPIIIIRIPCAEPGESDFHLEISRQDDTHVNCKDKAGWEALFTRFGYGFHLRLDLQTIYDAPGVMSAILFKSNA